MNKKKIVILLTAFTIFFLTLYNISGRAHNPSNIGLAYNSSTGVLSVAITHNSGGNSANYVDSVIISVNGSIVSTNLYTSQPDPSTFTYEYDITANNGATIQVTATCEIVGSLTKSLTVETGGGSTSNGTQAISGYIGLWLIIGLSMIAMLSLIKKKMRKMRG